MRPALPPRCGLLRLIVILLGSLGVCWAASPDETVVLANALDENSVRLAEQYAEARQIPSAQVIRLPLSGEETISGEEFIKLILNPLRRELLRRNLWIGQRLDGEDEFGRERYQLADNQVRYLVLCRGVPLRISDTESWLRPVDRDRLPEPFRVTRGSVDGQLALLVSHSHPLAGPIPNPLFKEKRPSLLDHQRVIAVTRLDGPSYAAARAVFESSIEAEEKGFAGRAYIDLSGRHPSGDEWLARAASLLREDGWDVSLNGAADLFETTDRFDAPFVYLGWYARHVAGVWSSPLALPPRGAIALHIHSFSATSVRTDRRHWVGPLVARGAAVVPGNVYEPYLESTLRPDLFLEALLSGKSVGEASLYAHPVLGWQQVLIADPLYRPFADGGRVEWDRFDPLQQYAVIRELNLLVKEGEVDAAIELGKRRFGETPGHALALRVVELMMEVDRPDEALDLMEFLRAFEQVDPVEALVVVRLAELWHGLGRSSEARRLFEKIDHSIERFPELRREVRVRGSGLTSVER